MVDYGFFLHELKTRYDYKMPPQCTDKYSPTNSGSSKNSDKPRLSLKNLAAAFAILLIGYTSALIAFLGEKFYFKYLTKTSIELN